jgi:energy-coupling factor transporter ATP-binding protein EcfA2
VQELAAAEVYDRTIDELIPVRGPNEPTSSVARFVEKVVSESSGRRWVVTGAAGSGKSTLLHRLAVAANSLPSSQRIAVVVPLATYDWARERLVDWIVAEIAQGTGIAEKAIKGLLTEERLLLLLDGLETVPTAEVLEGQGLPTSELPLFDRLIRRRVGSPIDPRKRLISKLSRLSRFVVTVREEVVRETDEVGLGAYSHATLEAIPRRMASDALRAAAPNLSFTSGLEEAIRTPLYLRLAIEVCGEHSNTPSGDFSREELRAWLWDRHLDIHLTSRDSRELGWEPKTFRRWLSTYATAAAHQEAMSFRRWPLLYGPKTRLALRGGRSAASALLAGALALLFGTPLLALLTLAVTFPIFFAAGEGAATRPMAPQRFTAKRFLREALRQWMYILAFTIGGAIFSLVIGNWGAILRNPPAASVTILAITGAGAGFLLGLTVPALYELSYLDEASLQAQRFRGGSMGGSVLSAAMIGITAGLIVALALEVAFPTTLVFFAIPICIGLALLDTLGLPAAAVALWALQRRGPLRVEAFLAEAKDLQLARRFGQFYFIEHSELQRFLAQEPRLAHDGGGSASSFARSSVALLLCVLVTAWLIGYSLFGPVADLPGAYLASHWRTLWEGFDLGMAALGVTTVWLLIRASALAALPAAMLSALLLADGWFDCWSAQPTDLTLSLLSLIGEVPAALFFLVLAIKALDLGRGEAEFL